MEIPRRHAGVDMSVDGSFHGFSREIRCPSWGWIGILFPFTVRATNIPIGRPDLRQFHDATAGLGYLLISYGKRRIRMR